MRIDKLHIYSFKNLRDFTIDLDRGEMYTVLLGQNAAGKSNFIEALVLIFRELYLDNDPVFSYDIEYHCNEQQIRILARHDSRSRKERYRIFVKDKNEGVSLFQGEDEKEVKRTEFKRNHAIYLPRYVIAYYSGISNRLEEHFDPHQKIFYRDLLNGKDDPLRPLFYARPIHSNFVLMSFFSFLEKEEVIENFLRNYFGIIDLDSILFVLKKPNWVNKKSLKVVTNDEISFYEAKGTVSSLLKDLYELALAPIQDTRKVQIDFRREVTEELTYLYISGVDKLRQLAQKYKSNINFFKVLESTYISDFIYDVRIKVKKIDNEGDIVFKEMSEGEQQLLTVLGLLRFTKSEESLILLDEPDTHLNPIWKWRYIKLLRDIVDKPDDTQIIMTSHDPLIIGSLTKEEIRIFEYDSEDDKIYTSEPAFDPKGLGVAGILTSEFFNLPSILDEDSMLKLDRKRELNALSTKRELTAAEQDELEEISEELDQHGIDKVQRDPLYQKFITAVYSLPEFRQPPKNKKERERQDARMVEVLKKIIAEEQ